MSIAFREGDLTVGTCVIVANQTIGGEQFTAAINDRVKAGTTTRFYVVVPATLQQDQLGSSVSLKGTTKTPSPDQHAYALATQRLDAALDHIRGAGGQADGAVGSADPVQAVRDALAETAADEIIIVTLPVGISKWLRMDLPSKVQRLSNLPVTQILSQPAAR